MVLYFSATGNSQYVAEQIAAATNDDVVSLNHLIKQNDTSELISENRPFVFVCPVYAWRLPRIVSDFIERATFSGSNQVYFIVTCGGESANTIHHARKLCDGKGWELQGFAEVVMPDNYIAMFPGPDRAAAKAINEKAAPVIAQTAADIAQGKVFSNYVSNGLSGKLESGIVNSLFYSLFVREKGFHTTDRCVGCGKCVELCPLNNIELAAQKPVWGNCCTHCMACINRCPVTAVEYKNKTQNKPRYCFDESI